MFIDFFLMFVISSQWIADLFVEAYCELKQPSKQYFVCGLNPNMKVFMSPSSRKETQFKILKVKFPNMHDNVELNLDDNDIISVEDIIKIYDTSKTVEESFPIKKTSRNRKNSETLCGSNLTKCF